jgi:Ca-activated chloride channel family protein
MLLTIPLLITTPARGAEVSDSTLSPYFFVQGGDPGTDRLPLLGTKVTAHVAGVIAEVSVRQTYKNDGTRPIHARYVFPASTRAAVHGLTMTIGNRVVTARIREREQASREFEEARRSGRNAALLEQQRPNVFTMDVANIVPGQRIDVELHYTELLVPTQGVYEFVYPTVVGPRYSTQPAAGAPSTDRWIQAPYTHQDEPARYELDLSGTVSAGVPIHDLVSPSHAIETRESSPSEVSFSLTEIEREGGNRDFVLRYRLQGETFQSGLMLHEGPEENFFLMMVQPPRRVASAEIPAREYVFVIDVSGSMHGFPLNTAKALVRGLVGRLRPTDSFNVLLFSGGSRLWSPESRPATRGNVAAAISMLEQEQGGGGTELRAALQRATELPGDSEQRSRSLIVITDGYIGAENDVFDSIRLHLGQANLFAFGIGSSVNRHLIEGMARAGMGEPFVVLGPEEAPEAVERFCRYVQSPLLTGIRVRFDGFEAYDIEPSTVPDLLAERPMVVFGKWRGRPAGRAVVTGFGGSGPFEQSLEISHVSPAAENQALRYLWARSRVADLCDRAAGEAEKRALVELGLRYNLLTPYTSFIAVHEEIRNPAGGAEDVDQPLPLPHGVSDRAIGMGMGDEPGMLWLVTGVVLCGLWITLRLRAGRAAA